MNRRGFLRSMLGVAAATALPSEIWPFRKIFVPENPVPLFPPGTYGALSRAEYPGRLCVPLSQQQITALELEYYAKEIPDLFHSGSALYSVFKRRAAEAVLTNGIAFIDRNGVYTYDDNEKMVKISETPMRIPLTLDGEQLKSLNAAYEESKKLELLHAPATPNNIMEFIDGLEEDFS